MTNSTDMRNVERVQQLAEEYASYAASRSGLGNVLGGVAGLVIYLINGIVGRSLWTTIVTIGLTLLWLVGKEIIRHRVYQSFGEARERWSQRQRRNHFLWAILTTLATIGIWVWLCLTFILVHIITLFQLILGLTFATSMPWIVWRYLHNEDELAVGIFLLLCCTIVSVGTALVPQGWEGWVGSSWVAIYALILLLRGLEEHRRFRQLARQLHTYKEDH